MDARHKRLLKVCPFLLDVSSSTAHDSAQEISDCARDKNAAIIITPFDESDLVRRSSMGAELDLRARTVASEGHLQRTRWHAVRRGAI